MLVAHTTLLEISCRGSYVLLFLMIRCALTMTLCAMGAMHRPSPLCKETIHIPTYKPNEPWHEISNNVVCATSKASDQPAHMRRRSEPLLVS